jgi:hypothetical protein
MMVLHGNKVIKMCAKGLYETFTNLINLMFLSGQFPQSWKLANVIPLFKKGYRQFKVNYRPISLLPSLSKIAERVVFTRLYCFFADIGFFILYNLVFDQAIPLFIIFILKSMVFPAI